MLIQTEYEFTLPRGYIDMQGNIHRQGVMRLAAAIDEIEAMREPSVKKDQDYLPVVLLSKVITRLGELDKVTPEIISKLFTADFAYLQQMYESINQIEDPVIQVQCPHCGKIFTDSLNFVLRE